MKNKSWLFLGLIAGIIVVGSLAYYFYYENTPGKLDSFATCLGQKGLKFYGAFWCPHCQAQKALFGKSAHLLPYHECSNPDGQSQNAMCNSLGISSYPTWVYPDNSTTTGEQSLQDLSTKSGCPLPANAQSYSWICKRLIILSA